MKPNQPVKVLDRNGNLIAEGRITKVLAFRGLERVPIEDDTSKPPKIDVESAGG